MTYKMIQFNPLNGQLIVDVEGQQFNVDVPIEDGNFISGEHLDTWIKACIPNHHFERQERLKNVGNAEAITAMCSEPIKHRETAYWELREKSYPPMSDYLDAVVKDDKVAMQAYIDRCKEVKAMYPKPETVIVSDEVLRQRREGLS